MSVWCLLLLPFVSRPCWTCPGICYCDEVINTMNCTGSVLKAVQPLRSNFTRLILSHMDISHLPEGAFFSPNHWIDVAIDETGLGSIEPGAFRGLVHLLTLSLRHNVIHTLPSGVFEGLVSLEELRLDGNRLEDLGDDIFLSTPQLRKLVLDNNLIKVLTVSTFNGMPLLRVLSVSHNFIRQNIQGESTEDKIFQHVLEFLDLSGNNLKELYVSDELMTSLTSLKVNYNNIGHLVPTNFMNMPALQRLYLRGNLIYEIRRDTFRVLTKLTIVDLSDNRLINLDPDIFSFNHNLSTLYLSANSNLTIPQNKPFINSKSLRVIDISGCKFDVFSNSAFANMPSLKEVRMKLKVTALKTTTCMVSALERHVAGSFYVIMFLLGITGTGSIMFLFVCTPETLCMCLLNAAAADLLLVLVTLPLSCANALSQMQDIAHCRMFCFTREVFIGTAVFSVAMHSSERYETCVKSCCTFFTRKVSCLQMVWVWSLAVLCALPAYWSAKIQNGSCHLMSKNIFGSCWMIWCCFLFLYCIAPAFLSILLHTLTMHYESKKATHMASGGIFYVRRVRWEVPALTVAFVISFAPSYIVRILIQTEMLDQKLHATALVEAISYCVLFSHAWIAPLLLYYSNASVKSIFNQVYGCNCGAQEKKAEDASVSDITIVKGTVLY